MPFEEHLSWRRRILEAAAFALLMICTGFILALEMGFYRIDILFLYSLNRVAAVTVRMY